MVQLRSRCVKGCYTRTIDGISSTSVAMANTVFFVVAYIYMYTFKQLNRRNVADVLKNESV